MIPCSNTDWNPPVVAKRNPDGTTRYVPHGEISLIHDILDMPDASPVYFHGGGKVLPWVLPVYGASAEVELADFFYSLIRLLKPKLVVEAGCHRGFTTYALGRACLDNGFGRVVTCDTEAEMVAITRKRCAELPVLVTHGSALSPVFLELVAQGDFVFIDSGTDTDDSSRIPVLQHVKQGALAAIHDTKNDAMLQEGLDATQMKRVDFVETHRGFTLLRKL